MPPKSSDKIPTENIVEELKGIKTVLLTLVEKINEFHVFAREICEKDERIPNFIQVSRQLNQVCENLWNTLNNRDDSETLPKTVEHPNHDNPRSVFVIKSRLGHLWNRQFIARKFAFWNMLKNYNKAELYEKW